MMAHCPKLGKDVHEGLMAVAITSAILAGSAVAGSQALIGSPQIRNGSIQLVDLSAKAKRALRGQRGPRGRQAPAGPAGVQGLPGGEGPQGPAGASGASGGFDPSKVTYVHGATIAIAANAPQTILAVNCPSGQKVLAGGYFASVGFPFAEIPFDGSEHYEVTIDNTGGPAGEGSAIATCAAR
jgi:hypothetical protein